MEDRLELEVRERRGGALTALAVILVITAAWWVLALWPVGPVEPQWLTRTRAACFGSPPGGLPNVAGWIVLIGEPLGMLGALALVFGRSLGRDLRWVAGLRVWRGVALAFGMLILLPIALIAARLAGFPAPAGETFAAIDVVPRRVDRAAPAASLVDQNGATVNLAQYRGRSALVTFAYGHCATVCPTTVLDLRTARARDGLDIPLIVLTLDPWRDTPDRLPTLAEAWQLEGEDRVLSGSIADVERVLDALGVARSRNEQNGEIEHAATAMLLDDTGRITWRVDGAPRQLTTLLKTM